MVDEAGEADGPEAPVAPDRPYVDGTRATPDELRAEVAAAAALDEGHVEELRAEVADTLSELSGRLDRPIQAARTAVSGTKVAAVAIAAVTLVLVLGRRLRRRTRSRRKAMVAAGGT